MNIKNKIKKITKFFVPSFFPTDSFECFLRKINIHNIYVVQIGACDGFTSDPIYSYIKKYHWQGVLVEPIPFLFKKLKKFYKDHQGLSFENSAIYKNKCQIDMLTIDPKLSNISTVPDWFFGYSSLARSDLFGQELWTSTVGKEIIKTGLDKKTVDKYVHKIKVNAITWANLIEKYSIKKIDLLQIDAEGYDFEILQQIDYHQISPKLIHFEYGRLSDIDFGSAIRFLIDKGYVVVDINFNDILLINSKFY